MNSTESRYVLALSRHIADWQDRQFLLGESDCVTFTCRWVDAQRGSNYLERVRKEHQYASTFTALRIINNPQGYEKLVQEITGCRGDHAPHAVPEVGDVVLYANEVDGATLGIAGSRLVYSPGKYGVVASDICRVTHSWSLSCL